MALSKQGQVLTAALWLPQVAHREAEVTLAAFQ